jgi:hypothetical protein
MNGLGACYCTGSPTPTGAQAIPQPAPDPGHLSGSVVDHSTGTQPAGLPAAPSTHPLTSLPVIQEQTVQLYLHPDSAPNLTAAPQQQQQQQQQSSQVQNVGAANVQHSSATAATHPSAAPSNTPTWPWSGNNPQAHSSMAFMIGGTRDVVQLQPPHEATSTAPPGPVPATAATAGAAAGRAGVGGGRGASWAGPAVLLLHAPQHALVPIYHPASGAEHVGHSSGGLLHSSVPFSVPSLLDMLGTALEPILEVRLHVPAAVYLQCTCHVGVHRLSFHSDRMQSAGRAGVSCPQVRF